MAAAKQSQVSFVNRVGGVMRLLELERAYFIFAVIYFPVAWLFYNQTNLEKALLAFYTVIMMLVGVVLLAKFALTLAMHANDRTGRYGSLFLSYLLNAFVPLVMFKVYGAVIMWILPLDKHRGLMCDLVRFIRYLYFEVLQFQSTLNAIIGISLLSVFVLALWSVGRSHK